MNRHDWQWEEMLSANLMYVDELDSDLSRKNANNLSFVFSLYSAVTNR